MPRVARVVIPGVPHHVTQRGNNRQDVFFTDDDRRAYLQILAVQSQRFKLAILGYCLMTNHVHLLAVPERKNSLARAVGRTHYLYTLYINRLHGRSGHLWQNRFFSCGLDDKHAYCALRYVELNPVRARIARRAWTYAWSSAAAHCGEGEADRVLTMESWRRHWNSSKWREELARGQSAAEVLAMRRNTHTGRPLGGDSFVSKLEHALNRRLRPFEVGRPRKAARKK